MFVSFVEQATGIAALMQPEIGCCEAESQGEESDEDTRGDCPPGCCSACAPLRAADRPPSSEVVLFVVGEWLDLRDESPPLEPDPRRVRHVPRHQVLLNA